MKGRLARWRARTAGITGGIVLGLLAGCGPMHAPSNTADVQELREMVESWDGTYVKGQHACLSLGFRIEQHQEAAHTFTCQRLTGERIVVIAKPGPLYRTITFTGRPSHDVSDLVAAYERQRL